MSLDWEHIEQWDAGEIALLALISALLLLLIVLLVCIIHYGRIYHELKRHELKPLYQYDSGDGPTYRTGRPEYAGDSSDDEDEPMSGVNNVNLANKEIRRSLGAGPLVHHQRFSTNATHHQSTSTESDSSTGDSNDDSVDTQSNLKSNIKVLTHLEDDDEDEDESVQKMYMNHHNNSNNINHNNRSRGGHQYSVTMQAPPPHPQYTSYIHPQHAASMQLYQGTYGNDVMQQQHHRNQQMLSHEPPPPPGAMSHSLHPIYGMNISPMHKSNATRHSHHPTNSGSFDTRTGSAITSMTGTGPLHSPEMGAVNVATNHKVLEYPNQNPIDDHLDDDRVVPHFIHSPSKSPQDF